MFINVPYILKKNFWKIFPIYRIGLYLSYMKYIISEEQNMVLHVRRRIESDFDLILEIIYEGMDMYLCQINDFELYFKLVCEGSAMTYLFNYFRAPYDEGYNKMEDYMIEYIKKKFTKIITDYWDDEKVYCLQ